MPWSGQKRYERLGECDKSSVWLVATEKCRMNSCSTSLLFLIDRVLCGKYLADESVDRLEILSKNIYVLALQTANGLSKDCYRIATFRRIHILAMPVLYMKENVGIAIEKSTMVAFFLHNQSLSDWVNEYWKAEGIPWKTYSAEARWQNKSLSIC